VKPLVAFGQQTVDLAGRDVDAQIEQLFVNQRLRDAVLMVLIEHVTTQGCPEMSLHVRRQRSRLAGAAGQEVPQSPVARVVGLDAQVLDHEILVAVLSCAFGEPFQRQGDGFVNGQLDRLLSFGRAGPLFAPLLLRFVGGVGVRGVQRARADLRPSRQPLQPGDLIAQRLNLRLLFFDHSHQTLFQRRQFSSRQFAASNLDRLGSIHALQETPKPPSK